MEKLKCECCGKRTPSNKLEFVDGRQPTVIEVCKKCKDEISSRQIYKCDICKSKVELEDIFMDKEKGQKKYSQLCRRCLHHTLLWEAIDGIIAGWTHYRFEEPDQIKEMVVKT